MIPRSANFSAKAIKPAGALDVDIHELWRVRLQHADSGKDQRAEVFQ